MKTNNVTRLLDSRRIPYTAFDLPDEKLGAVDAARHIGAPPEQVFKTIVVLRQEKGKPILAIVPGPGTVDLKALARVIGEKKVHLPSEREAEAVTGLQAGGISPLALVNKGFQVIVDQSVSQYKEVYISGGQRGLNILLPVNDLIRLVGARLAPISAAE
jgi:Cys-tRNA(Pro)/Cys-tRNA(Cys) deacylase